MRCLRPSPIAGREDLARKEGDLMTSSAAAAAARATAAWRLFQGEADVKQAKEGIATRNARHIGTAPRTTATVQAPSSPELSSRLAAAMKARTVMAEEKARLPAPVPSVTQRPAALLSARGETSRVTAPGSPPNPDPLRAGLQAPYATESPDTVKGALANRRRTYHEHFESSRQAVHSATVPMTGSESLASLATQAPTGVMALQPGMEQFSGRKSLVESEPTGTTARQEKTLVAQRRQQQPRQASNVQRRRSQPQEGYQEEDKAKPVAVAEKSIPKVDPDYGKPSLFRARSVLPTLNERPPLSDIQAGYAAPVLLGHPMNREPARPWEPKCDLDSKTQVPESIFKAMEKLGHAARHRGQHILAKSSRHRGRKTLIRHDCIPGRVTTDYNASSQGFEARSERNQKVVSSAGERRNPVPTANWRSVLGIASKETLLRSF